MNKIEMKTLIINNTTIEEVYGITIEAKKLTDCPEGYYRNLYKLEFELPKKILLEFFLTDITSFKVKGCFDSSIENCKVNRIQTTEPVGLCEDFVDCYLYLESQNLIKEGC